MHSDEKPVVQFWAFFAMLSAIYIALFYGFKAGKEIFALAPDKLLLGEVWRIFTYQFVHNSQAHLFENLAALLLSILLAIELKSLLSDYSSTYFASGVIAILPIWFISPFFALGASSAIYASFGFLSRFARRYRINPLFIVGAITAITVGNAWLAYSMCDSCTGNTQLLQVSAHLAGLLFGFMLAPIVMRLREKLERRKMACLRSLSQSSAIPSSIPKQNLTQ